MIKQKKYILNPEETVSKVTVAQKKSHVMNPACLKRLIRPEYMSGAAVLPLIQKAVIRMFRTKILQLLNWEGRSQIGKLSLEKMSIMIRMK